MFTVKLRPISNQGDWSTAIQINDKATGTPVDLTGDSFIIALRRRHGSPEREYVWGWPGSNAYDWSSVPPDLVGSTATGELTLPSLGIIQVYFPIGRIQNLRPGSYDIGLVVNNGTFTMQVFVGTAPVVEGFVGGVTV